MAGSREIKAGRAYVELFTKDSKLIKGLARAQARLKAFGSFVTGIGTKLVGLGAAVLAPLGAAAKVFSSYGDSVAKMSKRTGVSVEALSELQFVAAQTGTEFATLEGAFRKMQRSIYDAGRGLSTQTDALADLNLAYSDLDGLAPEEQFKILADRIGRVADPTKRAAIAMSLMGRTGTNLLPMFAEGAAGIEKLQAEARRLGLTMSGEDAKAAEDFTDSMQRLFQTLRMGAFRVGAAIGPILQELSDRFAGITAKAGAWIAANRAIVVTVLKIGAAMVAAGAGFLVLGGMIRGLAGGLGLLKGALLAIGVTVKIVMALIMALVSPIGLLIAAVAAIGTVVAIQTGAAGKALGWLGDRFNDLKDTAMRTFKGIADAIAAGNIALAVKVLWLSIKMEFLKGTQGARELWVNLWNGLADIATGAWYDLQLVLVMIWEGLKIAWVNVVSFFSRVWVDAIAVLSKVWTNFVAGAEKAWNWLRDLTDDSFDREAADAEVDRKFNESRTKQESARKASLDQIAADQAKDLDAIRTERANKLSHILDLQDKAHKARMEKRDADLKAIEDEIKAAKAEWEASLKDAADARAAKDAGMPEMPAGAPKFDPKEIAGGIAAAAGNAISVTSTFSAAAAAQMGGGDAIQRGILAASEDIADNTEEIARAIGDTIVPTFG